MRDVFQGVIHASFLKVGAGISFLFYTAQKMEVKPALEEVLQIDGLYCALTSREASSAIQSIHIQSYTSIVWSL